MPREYSVSAVVYLCPNIYCLRVMSDLEFEMDLDYDTKLLYCKDKEPEVVVDCSPALPADQLQSLVCGEDLYTNSQLVELVDTPTQDPMLPPAWDAETELALQSSNFSWAEDVEQEAACLKQSSEGQQGQGVQSLHHSPI